MKQQKQGEQRNDGDEEKKKKIGGHIDTDTGGEQGINTETDRKQERQREC